MFYMGHFFVCFINLTLYTGKIHFGDLGEGYNVVRSVKETISLYKNNRYTISLYKNNHDTISLYKKKIAVIKIDICIMV